MASWHLGRSVNTHPQVPKPTWRNFGPRYTLIQRVDMWLEGVWQYIRPQLTVRTFGLAFVFAGAFLLLVLLALACASITQSLSSSPPKVIREPSRTQQRAK